MGNNFPRNYIKPQKASFYKIFIPEPKQAHFDHLSIRKKQDDSNKSNQLDNDSRTPAACNSTDHDRKRKNFLLPYIFKRKNVLPADICRVLSTVIFQHKDNMS